MFFDWTYVILVLPAILLAMWASANVNSTFRRYSTQYSRRGITGAQAARRVLDANGLQQVRIERVSGHLTDHYDPRDNVIRLSDNVFGNTSTAAIGVACHEAGQAVQHAVKYVPIQNRSAIIPITNIGSRLSMPLILVGPAVFHVQPPDVLFGICRHCLFRLGSYFSAGHTPHRIQRQPSGLGSHRIRPSPLRSTRKFRAPEKLCSPP